jgi:hypothetical protein
MYLRIINALFFIILSFSLSATGQIGMLLVVQEELPEGNITDQLGPAPYSIAYNSNFTSATDTPSDTRFDRTENAVLEFTINLSDLNDGCWWEVGASGRGSWLGLEGGALRFRAGQGGSDPSTDLDMEVPVATAGLTTGVDHTIVLFVHHNYSGVSDSAAVWVDNTLVMSEIDLDGFSSGEIAGGNIGSYGKNARRGLLVRAWRCN